MLNKRLALYGLLASTVAVICIAMFIKTVGIDQVERQIQENGDFQFDWTPDEIDRADAVLGNYVGLPLVLQIVVFALCQVFVIAEMTNTNWKKKILSLACDAAMLASIFICLPDLFYLVD